MLLVVPEVLSLSVELLNLGGLRRFVFLDEVVTVLVRRLTLRSLAALLDVLLDRRRPCRLGFLSGAMVNLRRRFKVRSSATVLALSDIFPDWWLRVPRLLLRVLAEEVTFELRQLPRSLALSSVV